MSQIFNSQANKPRFTIYLNEGGSTAFFTLVRRGWAHMSGQVFTKNNKTIILGGYHDRARLEIFSH